MTSASRAVEAALGPSRSVDAASGTTPVAAELLNLGHTVGVSSSWRRMLSGVSAHAVGVKGLVPQLGETFGVYGQLKDRWNIAAGVKLPSPMFSPFVMPRLAQAFDVTVPSAAWSAVHMPEMPALKMAMSMPDLSAAFGVFGVTDRLQEFLAEAAVFERFMSMWEEDPLWFLLSIFGLRAMRRLAPLTRAEVEDVLLEALGDVVLEGKFVERLRKVVSTAPFLNDLQRDWLDHALIHAVAGEWTHAVPPMLLGLEGALHRGAVVNSLIVDRRGKFVGPEKLVKLMAVDEAYTAFVTLRVFGGIGQAFRHGRAESGERAQVLFGIVALAGWADFFLGWNAMDVLAAQLYRRLDHAIGRVRGARQLQPPKR